VGSKDSGAHKQQQVCHLIKKKENKNIIDTIHFI